MTKQIKLQERLDFGAVSDLKSEMLSHVGSDVTIDASEVIHMGTLCLQVLISAANDWARSGHEFNLISPSDACLSQLALHGFSSESLIGVMS